MAFPAAARCAALAVLAPMLCLAAAVPEAVTEPAEWPTTFHAHMLQNRSGEIAEVDLYYDWPGGRNLHIIRGKEQPPFFDNELQNGSTYFYTPSAHACKMIDMKVGLLPPTWLKGAKLREQVTLDTMHGPRLCNVWEKGDAIPPATGPFVVYYEDVALGIPARWIFFSGAVFDMLSWQPGKGPESEAVWEVPQYCFGAEAAAAPSEGQTERPLLLQDAWRTEMASAAVVGDDELLV